MNARTIATVDPALRKPRGASGRLVTPERLIMAVFFLEAVLLTNWPPRIPDIEAALGLSHRGLALAMIGMPIGTFISVLMAGPLFERLTARRALLIALPVYCVTLTLPGWAWDGPSLFAGLFLLGVAFAFVDVGMNVEAARLEVAAGRRIMNTCHGFWSTGSMVGAVMAGSFAQAGLATGPHLLIVAVLALPVGLMIVRALPSFRPIPSVGRSRRVFAFPPWSLIGLCMFAFGMVMVELVARNWGGVFLKDLLDASPSAIGAAIGVFGLFMAIGRFLGDRLSDRFGPTMIARICGVLAVAGVALTTLAGGLIVAMIGFVAMGLGVSIGFPLAVSAAAARGDRPPATNVAGVALFAYSSSLVGPTMVGFVADAAGLRIGFATVLPLIVLSTLLASQLRPRPRPGLAPASGSAASLKESR